LINFAALILLVPVAVNVTRKPAQALLYVPPKMTKTEVKEYLTKIYNVNVLAVMTANFLGEGSSEVFRHLSTPHPRVSDFILVLMYSFYVHISQVNGKDYMEREKSFRTKEEISRKL
jgi:Ribosomal protein L23